MEHSDGTTSPTRHEGTLAEMTTQGAENPSPSPPHTSLMNETTSPVAQESSQTRVTEGVEKPPIQQIRLTWLLTLPTIALFTLTVYIAFGNTGLLQSSSVRSSIRQTILVLRVLSELTALCMASLIDGSLERLQWMLTARTKGFLLPGFLSLGSGTGKLGMLNLLHRDFRGGGRWSLLRLILALGVPALSVITLSSVNAGLYFEEYTSFPVAAGIGNFKPSNVRDWREIAALQISTDFKNFLQNSQLAVGVDPISIDRSICSDSDIFTGRESCGTSSFVHGGLQLVTPSPTRNNSIPNSYVYLVKKMRGLQIDFHPLALTARFDGTTDCLVAGNEGSAVQFCVSNSEKTIINAKYVQCPILISGNSSCLTDTSWLSSSGWTTSMIVHQRTADVYFSRYNFSTVAIRNLSPPIVLEISHSSLLDVFNTTFSGNTLGFSSNSPGQQFITYLSIYLSFAETSSFGRFEAGNYLRNLLALPLYYFQPTYLSEESRAINESNVDEPNPAVPPELHTAAAFADPSYQLLVAKWSIWLYTIGGAVMITFCLVLLIVGSLPYTAGNVPDTTLWPAIDLMASCDTTDTRKEGDNHGGLQEKLTRLNGLGLGEKVNEMKKIRVFVKN
jgi:hypothetical protein